MYFCPQCMYSFDICKASTIAEEKIVLKKVSDAIKAFENNEDLNNYSVEFRFEELEKNSKFKKLSTENKEKFNVLFEIATVANAEFKCNNCNYTKKITESVLLYQYDVNNKTEKIKNFDENKLITQDPRLPRTHDYICKNINCQTNKNNEIIKEAVFLRDKESYKINYICCVCYYNW